jgi:hypothetical protein
VGATRRWGTVGGGRLIDLPNLGFIDPVTHLGYADPVTYLHDVYPNTYWTRVFTDGHGYGIYVFRQIH